MSANIDQLRSALAGRYTVDRELGAGGTATVFLATDLKHDRPVAIKVLHPELAAALGAERFLHEIAVTANLRHPHILPLFDSGEAGSLLFYVMPYAEGESIRQLLDRETTLPVGQAIKLMQEILAALAHAHEQGVIHRDIKPANILLVEGQALVADFGISMGSSTHDGQRLTEVGLAVGTPTYMSPEQIEGDRSVDLRTDIYAMGCVLYEMLTGSPPFTGPSVHAIIAKAMTGKPPPVHASRPEVPSGLDGVISRALAANPEDRFASAREFAEALEPQAAAAPASRWQRAAIAGLVAVATVMGIMFWQNGRRDAARETLPGIAELAAAGEFTEAFALAVAAERVIPGDATLDSLMVEVSDLISVTTEPPGAHVVITRFDPEESDQEPVFSGTAPVEELRVPRVDHLVQLTMDGYVPTERLAESRYRRSQDGLSFGPEVEPDVRLALTMLPVSQVSREAVLVPGGAYQLVGPDAPSMATADLRDYQLDKFEVTNAEFRAFVVAGGYDRDEYWNDQLGSERSAFSDRTGLPGPRGWVGQDFPDGQGRHPVTGVNWHEAAAFCASMDSRLPTVFEWEKADRNGLTVPLSGTMMPWGVTTSALIFENRANFSSNGTTPVDAYPFGISQHGAHGMAGNAREWLLNQMGDGYTVTGGSWEDPSYLYPQFGSQPGTFASRSLGFRCARAVAGNDSDQGLQAFDLDERTPTYAPVDRATFRGFLAHYTYDRQPANPRVQSVEESDGWVRERIWIDGVEGDSVLIHFYIPKQSTPPYQTMVYVPGSSSFCCNNATSSLEYLLAPVIRGGRAAAVVEMYGMLERPFPPGSAPPPTGSVRFRDLMVRHATELRLGVDYLEQRDDVDMDKLAYVGNSWGAGSRIGFAAIEPRFKAFVLIAGGIDERVKPTLPEAENVNFAPYIDGPKVLINGTNDDEHPWASRGLPLWNLLSEPKELVLIEGAGHAAPLESRVPAVNGFLDRTLGPVERR